MSELHAFLHSQRGAVAMIFGLVLMALGCATGLALDYGRAQHAKSQLQSAVDSAALAAATAGAATTSERVNLAQKTFEANFSLASAFGLLAPSVEIVADKVTVRASANVPTTFARLLHIEALSVTAAAAAKAGRASACVLALQQSQDGIFLNGKSAIEANCGLQANSTSSNALDANGDSHVFATSTCVVGDVQKDSDTVLKPVPLVRCPAMADPLAALPIPSEATGSCTKSGTKVNGGTSATLNPGVYCGGIDIGSSAKVTFNPGIFVIRDGQFKIGSSAQVTGQNVFFYLTGKDANLDQGSSSHMNFTAPSSGVYKGIVFFQSRTAATANNRFGGSSTSIVQGAVYFPNGTAQINCSGTVGASADYTVWVVKRLQLDSGATLKVTSNYAGSSTPLADGLGAMVYAKAAVLSY